MSSVQVCILTQTSLLSCGSRCSYVQRIDRSRVYHFEARSTHRIVKNDGSTQFLRKWGITSSSFLRDILQRGEPYNEVKDMSARLKADLFRSKIKKVLTVLRDVRIKNIWED